MCSTDVYRIHKAEFGNQEEQEEKVDVELVSASARLQEAIVSMAK
jgi:hypothetical protein